jgi:hypothetical protein
MPFRLPVCEAGYEQLNSLGRQIRFKKILSPLKQKKMQTSLLLQYMTTTRKIAIGLGLAGGALLAAWLLTGTRKQKTKEFIGRKVNDLKKGLQKEKSKFDDSEAHYI